MNASKKAELFFTAIVTCHYEEKSVEQFHGRLKVILESIGRPYEIVIINDGSTDGTWERVKDIFNKDPNVRVIVDFAKNAGQFAAIAAGICEAQGQAIILMDSDLQLSPEELPNLVAEYDKGYDLVTGYRVHRRDALSRIIPSRIANYIMRRASQSKVSDFGCTFKIFRASILKAFKPGPHAVFNFVQIISKISKIKEIPVSHTPRQYGKSGWTFAKLWLYNMDNILLLLERPFQYTAFLSFLLAFLLVMHVSISFVFSGYKLLNEVTNGLILNAVAFSLAILSGILSLSGELILRSYRRSLSLPLYIIRERHEKAEKETE
ncbi:MAG TPA: glycosyltransferase family 2 protein [Candidatus Hydrogenedentes bacterium]|nr:glycosyltransferase family 2 protein [Candidatus Hydrogenedentota bacterium]